MLLLLLVLPSSPMPVAVAAMLPAPMLLADVVVACRYASCLLLVAVLAAGCCRLCGLMTLAACCRLPLWLLVVADA